MADTAKKTPNKRKSFPAKLESAKKQKLEKQTPEKQSNVENSAKKFDKKNKKQNNATVNSPKKMKPFLGIKTPNKEENKEKSKQNDGTTKSPKKAKPLPQGKKGGNDVEGKSKKKRKSSFYTNLDHLRNTGDETDKAKLLQSVEEKIKQIEGRGDLTKTARRKLNTLIKFKAFAEGKPIVPRQSSVTSKAGKKEQQKKAVNGNQQLKQNAQETKGPKQKNKPQGPAAKKAKLLKKEDSDDDDEEIEEASGEEEEASGEEEEASDEEASGEEEEASGEEEEESDDENEGNEDDEGESEDEVQPPPKEKTSTQKKQLNSKQTPKIKTVNLEDLEKSNIIAQSQKRYVLFVGNIPYDTTKKDLFEHFQKCGEIKHIRIPTEKGSNKPRGFAYVEVSNADIYQKSLSMHHTFLKGRRINVLYTTGGKKKCDEKKKNIKAKNLKQHAMRKQGQLLGSKKESQKRSFRRKKQMSNKPQNTQ